MKIAGTQKGTIEQVTRDGLCTGCGTCFAMCPLSAIEMRIDGRTGIYLPQVNAKKCNYCGICLDICPGYSVDFNQLNRAIFGKEAKDVLLGNYLNCYIGHATDSNIRYNSASGGLVTALLLFALDEGLIDGALVTRMSRQNQLEPEPFIARTRQEIIEASKSKYCPVPANIALKEILASKKEERFAVVGLPCHISSIRKAEKLNKKLKESIALHFGIFCSHTLNLHGTELLLSKLGVKSKDISKLSYRGDGWPGGIKIVLEDGQQKFISNQNILWNSIFGSHFFTPLCCFFCRDVTSELADISFGDAWLPEIVANERQGKSVVTSRSEAGETMLQTASSRGNIEISAVAARDIIRSQRTFLHFKKVNIHSRQRWKFREKQAEKPSVPGSSFYNKSVAAIALINNYFGYFRACRFLLRYIPSIASRLYILVFNMLYARAISRDFDKLERNGLNILILHAHWDNRGDEAAIRAMIDSLKSELVIKKMSIILLSPGVTRFPYDDIRILEDYPWIALTNNRRLPRILTYLDILLTLVTFGRLSLTEQGREFIKVVDEADIVIHAPGGPMIGDLYGGKLWGDVFYVYRLLIVKLFKKKPLFFYAPSMGPFSSKLRNVIRKFILRRADAIVLREEISAGYLKSQLGLDSYVTIDSALQSDVPEDYIKRYKNIPEILSLIENKKVIGMIITDLKWHPVYKHSNYDELRKRLIDSFSYVARYLIESGYVVLLIPQLFGIQEDISLLKAVQHLNNKRIFVLPEEIDSYAQQSIISKVFCLISMRYHPIVFAVKGSTPFISICYEHKTRGFVERVGAANFIIDVEQISTNDIIDRFICLKQNYNMLRERLEAINPSLREESRKTTKILLDKIAHLGWRVNRNDKQT
jgi:coenzyme F420 hydrogenase subunit beta